MTVAELIAELQDYDPDEFVATEHEIIGYNYDFTVLPCPAGGVLIV